MKKLLIKNGTLFLTGFCIYITMEVLFRGYSYPLMGIVGGLSLILIDKINDCISWDLDLILQSLIGGSIITALELAVGLLDKNYLFIEMWDYSNMSFNFEGKICLLFSCIWCLLSLIAIFLSDAFNYYMFRDTECPRYRVLRYRFHFKPV